ncbi:ATP-dependent nuclease [Oceanibaculum pacificum]|uniref:ATP-dependent endonuclease n=1 Tax=Oceanibaculum pacificum TaxID=580166 RepID=A0A154WFT4_9PROT|nr:AAA family ATPase [Oceanibaculum pacificum]KZD12388.1 ATP-dependent endonuclease [Oceanibaculum pacificum]
MRLETISVRNFRLLRRLAINLAEQKTTTVLVGPNNSGKTSVMDALRLFTKLRALEGEAGAKASGISFHDLSQLRHRDFKRIEATLPSLAAPEDKYEIARRRAPRMRVDLTFSYEDDPVDLVAATKLLMDLSPDNKCVRIRIEYALDNAKKLIDDFEIRPDTNQTLCDFLRDSFRTYFSRSYFKVSHDGKEVEKLEDGAILKRLLKIDVVPAQRHVDDDDNSRSAKLSKLLHDHYTKFYKANDADGYQVIEDALRDSAADLTTKYSAAFGRLTTRLQSFGYPQGQVAPDLRVRAELSAETIYRDNARIFYASQHAGKEGVMEEFELPEKYNGLGYKNLIYIVLQLESFRAALETTPDERPRVHIIAIEEPEAHLHPQMQTVFISEISKALEGDGGTTAQVILSTHSSHMIAQSAFEPVRYFRRNGRQVIVKDLSKLPLPSNAPEALDFLRRYIRLTHCDLFFADKAIFVEGQVERLLLPMMIEKCAANAGFEGLGSQYISISEVGGAYAHKFKPLVDFLGIPTLIVTDFDAIDEGSKKCPVAIGISTSNACLKSWLPKKTAVADLIAASDADKTEGRIRVVYQVAEGGHCGRSFEEAFIYANVPWLTTEHTKLNATADVIAKSIAIGLPTDGFNLSGKLGKVDFALDLMAQPSWATPKYIREGLEWLATQGTA